MHLFFQRLSQFLKRHSSLCIAIGLGLLFFCVQLLFINDYGVTWDEPLHRNWGKIFAVFLKTGDRRLLELMPGHGIDYGPLYYWLNYVLSEQLYAAHLFLFVAANHLLTVFTASVAVAFVFLLGHLFFGRRIAFFSVLFFVFFPSLLAHAHYNPKDIPLLTALLVTSFTFVKAVRADSKKLFVLTGFLLGISIALKVSALLMAPVFAVSYLTHRVSRSNKSRVASEIGTIVLITCAVIVGAVLAWPSSWGDLMLIPRAIAFFSHDFWPGKVLFFAAEYGGGELPWYYTPLEYAMAMPVLMIAAFIIGTLSVMRKFRLKSVDPAMLFLLLWAFFPLLFSLKPGLVRYDGMRQFFFCLPAIAVLAAVGFDASLALLRRRLGAAKRLTILCTTVLVVSLLHEVVLLHPFEGSYRNEIVRFLIPKDMDRSLQIEYWGASYKQGMEWLVSNAEPNPVICVPTAGILVTWYPWREDFQFECSKKSDYVMFFTRYSEAKEYEDMPMEPVFRITRMNATLLNVYKIR